MTKTKRIRPARSTSLTHSAPPSASWVDRDGIHTLVAGTPPSDAQLEEVTKRYQESIRASPLWDEMVRTYGRAKAEELLAQCRAKIA